MSTISTTASSELASEHARDGQGYVAAPVFGNPDAAKVRQLFVIAAGAPTMSNDEPISTVARIRCGAFTRKAGPMTTI